jgi:two-component system, cell cycle response regulator
VNEQSRQMTEETNSDSPRIMVIDGEDKVLSSIKVDLEQHIGYKVTTFQDAQNALDELKNETYDLVITDLEMPVFPGIKLIKEAKKNSPESDLIVMTKFPSVETAVKCMKIGAADYIAKPFDKEYFNLIIRKTLYKRTLEKRAAEREYYERISRIDGLTGLYNRNYFHNLMNSEISRAARYKHNFSLLMVDIDDFKKINDTYGHQVGDEVLKGLALLLNSFVRENDFVARYGGEEFAVILPQTAKEHGSMFGNRIVSGVASSKIKAISQDGRLTISAGLAGYPDDASTQKALIRKADESLYRAKRMGKNTLCVYGS